MPRWDRPRRGRRSPASIAAVDGDRADGPRLRRRRGIGQEPRDRRQSPGLGRPHRPAAPAGKSAALRQPAPAEPVARVSWNGQTISTSWQSARPKSPTRQDQEHARVAERGFQEDRDQGPDVAAAADGRAGLERRRELVDQPGATTRTSTKPIAGPSRSGTRPRRITSRLTTARPRSSSQDDQPSVMNRTWAKHRPDRTAGIGRRLIGRLGAVARRIGGVVADQAQAQEHDRQSEGDERRRPQHIAGARTWNPLGEADVDRCPATQTRPAWSRAAPLDHLLIGRRVRGPCGFRRRSPGRASGLFNLPVG